MTCDVTDALPWPPFPDAPPPQALGVRITAPEGSEAVSSTEVCHPLISDRAVRPENLRKHAYFLEGASIIVQSAIACWRFSTAAS
jgi:hypothetical protein